MTTHDFDVVIAGGGPAGSSAAIRLAGQDRRVLLFEQKKFPRPKLCGEFISPECLTQFRELGVLEEMLAAGATKIDQTVFYSVRGKKLAVPSEWFRFNTAALGLSRSEMDFCLLERAKAVGVTVIEDANVADVIVENDRVRGVKVKRDGRSTDYYAGMTIDATGRNRSLSRRFEPGANLTKVKRGLVAFKGHFRNARPANGSCEIYFYRGGYGGLNQVENGVSNLCFIVAARDVRELASDPDRVMREVVLRNARAAETLREARLSSPWLSVSLESFGRKSPAPVAGLLSIGDAASFIDPFTGSGMLMAMESGQLAAEAIAGCDNSTEKIAANYRTAYDRRFGQRLRVASVLRRAAFFPRAAGAAIFFFGLSPGLRRKVAQATRPQQNRKLIPS
ncbi:MAG TPA: NAD(P)/FAD-dependent oxidoreductase [Pyrinomonadaceae bacterium]|nr:NAD(P)/FAD-dependent oxidoreductase [Pyrinomonadaceae bacterium]